ncbi:MAG: hypothetical protein EON54_11345 [Alcaligenaceae bacterium]|nr:MAG: hypothetical protein EON54_11345 [Alcaligenaceae bacterium]
MKTLSLCLLVIALAGCSTKNYGRQGAVSDYERQTLTCREIEIETAKVHGYLAQIGKESEFDGRSVLSFLGDFGIGNTMEKNAAMEAANKRLSQLQAISTARRCGSETMDRSMMPAP